MQKLKLSSTLQIILWISLTHIICGKIEVVFASVGFCAWVELLSCCNTAYLLACGKNVDICHYFHFQVHPLLLGFFCLFLVLCGVVFSFWSLILQPGFWQLFVAFAPLCCSQVQGFPHSCTGGILTCACLLCLCFIFCIHAKGKP